MTIRIWNKANLIFCFSMQGAGGRVKIPIDTIFPGFSPAFWTETLGRNLGTWL